MNRHALLEIMVEARIQPKRPCYAGSARYGWNLLFYVQLDNIIEIQTSCATKPRLRAGVVPLCVLQPMDSDIERKPDWLRIRLEK